MFSVAACSDDTAGPWQNPTRLDSESILRAVYYVGLNVPEEDLRSFAGTARTSCWDGGRVTATGTVALTETTETRVYVMDLMLVPEDCEITVQERTLTLHGAPILRQKGTARFETLSEQYSTSHLTWDISGTLEYELEDRRGLCAISASFAQEVAYTFELVGTGRATGTVCGNTVAVGWSLPWERP